MTTPAGWYPDGSGGSRYWDGRQWAAVTAPQAGRVTIHYGFALLAILSLLGTLGPCVMYAIGAASDPEVRGGGGVMFMWFLWGMMWTIIWSAFAINHTLKSRR